MREKKQQQKIKFYMNKDNGARRNLKPYQVEIIYFTPSRLAWLVYRQLYLFKLKSLIKVAVVSILCLLLAAFIENHVAHLNVILLSIYFNLN